MHSRITIPTRTLRILQSARLRSMSPGRTLSSQEIQNFLHEMICPGHGREICRKGRNFRGGVPLH